MKNQFWAVWAAGPVHEKKSLGLIKSNFLGFFYVFIGKKKFLKYCSVCTEKLHRKKVIFI
jgi:hypothetical protein